MRPRRTPCRRTRTAGRALPRSLRFRHYLISFIFMCVVAGKPLRVLVGRHSDSLSNNTRSRLSATAIQPLMCPLNLLRPLPMFPIRQNSQQLLCPLTSPQTARGLYNRTLFSSTASCFVPEASLETT
jgi:hypothetical protein